MTKKTQTRTEINRRGQAAYRARNRERIRTAQRVANAIVGVHIRFPAMDPVWREHEHVTRLARVADALRETMPLEDIALLCGYLQRTSDEVWADIASKWQAHVDADPSVQRARQLLASIK